MVSCHGWGLIKELGNEYLSPQRQMDKAVCVKRMLNIPQLFLLALFLIVFFLGFFFAVLPDNNTLEAILGLIS